MNEEIKSFQTGTLKALYDTVHEDFNYNNMEASLKALHNFLEKDSTIIVINHVADEMMNIMQLAIPGINIPSTQKKKFKDSPQKFDVRIPSFNGQQYETIVEKFKIIMENINTIKGIVIIQNELLKAFEFKTKEDSKHITEIKNIKNKLQNLTNEIEKYAENLIPKEIDSNKSDLLNMTKKELDELNEKYKKQKPSMEEDEENEDDEFEED